MVSLSRNTVRMPPCTHDTSIPLIEAISAVTRKHSCAPNLDVVVLRVGTVAPIVGLFANRPIAAGAELCYDYGASSLSEGEGGVGRKECRRWLPLSEKATD